MDKALEAVEALRLAITTASNDDLSEAGTDLRRRHVARIDAMQAAIDILSALPATDTSPTMDKALEAGARVTPEMIAAAWQAWHSRHGGKLGPGPAFVEAIAAALSVAAALPATDTSGLVERLRARADDWERTIRPNLAYYGEGSAAFDREVADAIEALQGAYDGCAVNRDHERARAEKAEARLAEAEAVSGLRTTLAAMERKLEETNDLILWALDTLQEINPSNYNHDDACRLNAASVEVIMGLARYLEGRK